MAISSDILIKLESTLEGELRYDKSSLLMYATDASAYREEPLAVCLPRTKDDLKILISFAYENELSLIPRAAGTSLAGQVVGNGIVVDISRHFNDIIDFNKEEHWVKVQPGVVLDELNLVLKRHGLFFGPETSTSNRCMIGGMLGNNSCGAHSLVYGSTRDHTLEVSALLSDGSEVLFGPLSVEGFEQKCNLHTLEGDIYRNIRDMLADPDHATRIREEFPDPEVERRNTGYAIDLLLEQEPFMEGGKRFNFSTLLAGSEGTLAFITEIKLNLVPLPPKHKGLLCVHLETLPQAFDANLVALQAGPVAIELMDDKVIARTENNISQRKNRFFIEGLPEAVLMIEFAEQSEDELDAKAKQLEEKLRSQGLGYHFPLLKGNEISKAWALRKAGLGLLSNIPGDAKPVPVIEDTAVAPKYLPDYMADFSRMLERYDKECVYYAHIATGELHLRPILNLKKEEDVDLFYQIARDTAKLVKKYRGSLSGEHGDGRLRGEFIPLMVGEENYRLLESIKQTWDPKGIFNPGKITQTPSMRESLRYTPGQETPELETILDFSNTEGYLRAVEQCNGSGDCRKSSEIGGVMCPSYMASRDESTTTRARANILREYISRPQHGDPWNQDEIYQVLDLCLSCKGCKSECPSNVDIAKYKAEYLQHYYDRNGIPLRSRMIAYITSLNKLGMIWPAFYNLMLNGAVGKAVKVALGFAKERKLPPLYRQSLRRWAKKNLKNLNSYAQGSRTVYLYADEFTNYNDVEVGISAIKLLTGLGYNVELPPSVESGRTFISKGLLRSARKKARKNINLLSPIIDGDSPLLGIEPSCILSFRDEYIDFAADDQKQVAKDLASNALMIEEFLAAEIDAGRIQSSSFSNESANVMLHGHCYQKSLASTEPVRKILSIPSGYEVEELPTGCCGMSGSFGYEKEHYTLSMAVGEMLLFPSIRDADKEVIIAASGTSCRHQIFDGTSKRAKHPVEILEGALKDRIV